MKQINLPYREVINWFLLCHFGAPLMVYVAAYLGDEKKDGTVAGILLWAFPTIIAAIFFTPLFKFKSGDKGGSDNALLKIPILEFYVLIAVGILSFFSFAGFSLILKGAYDKGVDMLTIGLPASAILLLAINSSRIWFKDHLIPGMVERELNAKRVDIGRFKYTDAGFIYVDKRKSITCNWAEVSLVMAYKSDSFAYDTIHLVFKTDNGDEFDIHEEVPGWFIFKDKVLENLIGTDKLWEMKVMYPPFEVSPTLVYERGKDLMADWGKEGR